MVNYKSKYLAMKLKYINAKQKAGMNTTDVVGSLLRMPLGAPQPAADLCANINMYTDNHRRFLECEKAKPQCEYKFNQCLKKGFAEFELNRDQLIRFTELFENVHFEDPDIIVIRVEVAQLKKNVDNDANNPTLKKELYKKIKQYIDLVKEEFPVSTIMELLGIKTEFNKNTKEFNVAIHIEIGKLIDEFNELDMMFEQLLDEENYLRLLQNYDRCKTITKRIAVLCNINKDIRSYCIKFNIDPNRMYRNLFVKNNIYSRERPEGLSVREKMLFRGVDLTELDLSNLDLSRLDFTYANLSGTNFNDATLIRTNFTKTELQMTEFQNANLKNAIFHRTRGYETFFISSDLSDANFTHAFLDDTHFDKSNLTNADFSNTSSDGQTTFYGSNLTDAKFIGAQLVRAGFGESSPYFGEAEGANLTNTNFSGAFLNFSDFSNTNLTTANFKGALLEGIILKKTIYNPIPSESPFKDATKFSENKN